jgi:hypothetical protein
MVHNSLDFGFANITSIQRMTRMLITLVEIIKEQVGFLFENSLMVDFNINVMMIISLNFNTLYQF